MEITLSINIQWSQDVAVVGGAVEQGGGGYLGIAKHAHPLAEEKVATIGVVSFWNWPIRWNNSYAGDLG